MFEQTAYRTTLSAPPWPPDGGSRAVFEELAMARSPSARLHRFAQETAVAACAHRDPDVVRPAPRAGRRW